MIQVFPVYMTSMCISKSTHDALLGPVKPYVYYSNHKSTEVHTVGWIPGPWKQGGRSTFFDAHEVAVDGHDTGMMIPHISPIMDNALLPITLLGSSCRFPFVSFAHKSGGKALCGFFPVLAPFLHCDAPKEGGSSTDSIADDLAARGKMRKPRFAMSREQRRSLDAAPTEAAMQKAAVDALTVDNPLRSRQPDLVGHASRLALAEARQLRAEALEGWNAAMGAFNIQINGRGILYIPTAKTVLMGMSLDDLILGWFKLFAWAAIDALSSAVLGAGKSKFEKFFDSGVATRTGWRRLEYYEIYVFNKAVWDGMVKSMVLDGKLKAPFGVGSYNFANGKGTALWFLEFHFEKAPISMWEGVNTHVKRALKKFEPIDTLTQTPNVAGS
jgi:hypothetical protein